MVVLGSKSVENFALLASSHSWILQNFPEGGRCLQYFLEVGKVTKDLLQSLGTRSSTEEGSGISTGRSVSESWGFMTYISQHLPGTEFCEIYAKLNLDSNIILFSIMSDE
jgi:hypothetical protein